MPYAPRGQCSRLCSDAYRSRNVPPLAIRNFFKMLAGNLAEAGMEEGLAESEVLNMCETRETSVSWFPDWMDEKWDDIVPR